MKSTSRNSQGFTIIEAVIILVVLGSLAAIGLVAAHHRDEDNKKKAAAISLNKADASKYQALEAELSAYQSDMIAADIGTAIDATTVQAFNSEITVCSTSILNAETEFSAMESDPLVHDSQLSPSFKAVANFNADYQYKENTIQDLKAIMPAEIQFVSSAYPTTVTQAAVKQSDGTVYDADLYVSNMTSYVSAAKASLGAYSAVTTPDKKLLSDFKAYLQQISSDLATDQQDLSTYNYSQLDTDFSSLLTYMEASPLTSDVTAIKTDYPSTNTFYHVTGVNFSKAILKAGATITDK